MINKRKLYSVSAVCHLRHRELPVVYVIFICQSRLPLRFQFLVYTVTCLLYSMSFLLKIITFKFLSAFNFILVSYRMLKTIVSFGFCEHFRNESWDNDPKCLNWPSDTFAPHRKVVAATVFEKKMILFCVKGLVLFTNFNFVLVSKILNYFLKFLVGKWICVHDMR